MAIIKLVEDKMNAEEDIVEGGVQAILLVEDSIRFYSTYLPELYKLILLQNTEFLKDALNEQQQILRKRARPKILLATNYEEAVELYDRYKKNMLGVISDVGFVLHRNDPPESEKRDAGIDLCRRIKEDNPLMPVLLQSSQTEFEAQARGLGAGFIAKNSKTLLSQLHEYIAKEFAFGDFLFKDPDTGAVIGRAKDLAQMQDEVHRFAISFHRNKRSKRQTASELDNIAGIGPKTKEAVLKRFGSVKQAKTATLETLQETVGAAKAKILFEFWHDETDN